MRDIPARCERAGCRHAVYEGESNSECWYHHTQTLEENAAWFARETEREARQRADDIRESYERIPRMTDSDELTVGPTFYTSQCRLYLLHKGVALVWVCKYRRYSRQYSTDTVGIYRPGHPRHMSVEDALHVYEWLCDFENVFAQNSLDRRRNNTIANERRYRIEKSDLGMAASIRMFRAKCKVAAEEQRVETRRLKRLAAITHAATHST